MSSSSFAPLAETVAKTFRPLGAPPPGEEIATPGVAPSVAAGEALRRAAEEGAARARDEARAELEAVSTSFAACVRELAEFRARLEARYERELLELALAVARTVVQQELSERPEMWLGMIRAAVERGADREHIALRAAPALMTFLRGALAELRASLADVKDLELIEDADLPAGGCVIESRFGDLDIGVETRLARCRRALVRDRHEWR